ncbi:glycosyltransferase family 4 protein [Corallincola platygyrae]|uniref:Glycosyltransferase family 4 protein n=1 Tax=Corallincola platygyrae TaxID=1193278 RepID=A0ABW4XGW4_9GAMM
MRNKLLILNDIGGKGGAEKILSLYSEILAESGFDVEVAFGSEGETYESVSKVVNKVSLIDPPKILTIKYLKLFERVYRLLSLFLIILRFKGKTVVTNTLFMQIFASPIVRLLGKELIWYEHNIQPKGFRRSFIRFYAKLFPRYIIAVSNAVADVYRDLGLNDKVKVIHNGIPALPSASKEKLIELKREFKLKDSDFVVVAISRITEYKGLHVLTKAIESITDENVKVFILGDTGISSKDLVYKRELVRTASGNVTFLGWRDDASDWISLANVFCAPAIGADPFPTTILEAMSLGAICIVSEIGGQPESIKNGHSGYLFKPGSSEELATIINNIKDEFNYESTFEVKRSALNSFKENFTIEKYTDRLNRVFQKIVEG